MTKSTYAASFIAFLVLLSALGCAGPPAIDTPDAGRSTAYEPGLPSFDLEAIATVRDGSPGIDAYVGFPRSSLVFRAADTALVARYELSLRVQDASGRETRAFQSFTDTLRARLAEDTRSYDRIRHRGRFALPAGSYVVEAVLEDGETDEQAVRRQRVEVPAARETPSLSRVLLLSETDGSVEPVVALHVPARSALRAAIEVYNPVPEATLELTIVRLNADTTIARPPFWIGPSRGSLVFRGVDLENADTLRVERVPLGADEDMQAATTALPDLAAGVYRLNYVLSDRTGVLDRQERTISVKGIGFPRLVTLAELVEALDYIAYDRELAFIAEGGTPQERRRRFDAFWGALVSDRRVASNLLRLYYERVEEANLLFTTVKPGWKTDRGMIYVVFGPPDYVEETFEGQVWHYGYGVPSGTGPFVFERVNYYGSRDPFGHYLLVRQPAYERSWTRALERWRSGEAL